MCDDAAYYDKVDEIVELEAEIRNCTIEECAQAAIEYMRRTHHEDANPLDLAAAIRALKSNTGG